MTDDPGKERIEHYYDQFRDQQQRTGVNLRHRTIHRHLVEAGLNADSVVLEVGCGIGTVSGLILRTVTRGRFVGVDISPASIQTARKLNAGHPNAEFVVNDMKTFTPDITFNFVVLPDVLEHIPVDQHPALFRTIAKVTSGDAVVAINIPEPRTQDWMRIHHPEKMQIIDQSLSLHQLVYDAGSAGFELVSVSPYCLHGTRPDYISILLSKPLPPRPYVLKSWLARAVQNTLSKFRG
jgi:trans-aconitate 2-methyltransferase